MPHLRNKTNSRLIEFLQDETGATAIEYRALAAILGLSLIGGASVFGVEYKRLWACMDASFRNLDDAC